MKIKVKDPIIKSVVKKFVDRSNVGFKKYGVTLAEDKSNMDEWLNHLQEELMDAVNYIERARVELKAIDQPDCCKKIIHCTCSKLDLYQTHTWPVCTNLSNNTVYADADCNV